MRNALIRHIASRPLGSVTRFSVDLADARPPRREKLKSELLDDVAMRDEFIRDVLEQNLLPDELRTRALELLPDE